MLFNFMFLVVFWYDVLLWFRTTGSTSDPVEEMEGKLLGTGGAHADEELAHREWLVSAEGNDN